MSCKCTPIEVCDECLLGEEEEEEDCYCICSDDELIQIVSGVSNGS